MSKITKTEEEWKSFLTEDEYYVTRQKGTEPPFSGKSFDPNKYGYFKCICCNTILFESNSKFESGSGWPSFSEPYLQESIKELTDHSLGMKRIEVLCNICDAHLGHVFDDGPKPSGLRYCINSLSLKFDEIK